MCMFEDGKCPMLESKVICEYGLSDKFVRRFCSYGCSVECGSILKELLDKKGMKPIIPAPIDSTTQKGDKNERN